MYRVELYAEVRRSVYVEGLSERAAARRFGLARECTAPGSLDTHLCYAAWRSSYSSRASIGV